MGKLLAKEIDILASKYSKLVEQQRKDYLNSEEYKKAEKKEISSGSYLFIQESVKRYQRLQEKINNLKQEQEEILFNLRAEGVIGTYDRSISENELESYLSKFRNKMLTSKKFKSRQDIEAIIVLASIEGGADFEANIMRMLQEP